MNNNYFNEAIKSIEKFIVGTIGIVDGRGVVVASSKKSLVAKKFKYYQEIAKSDKNTGSVDDYYFKKILTSKGIELVTFISKEDANCKQILDLFTANILQLQKIFKEKYDKIIFIKDVMLGNVFSENIHLRVDELGLDNEVDRVVYIVSAKEPIQIELYNEVVSFAGNKDKNFVLLIDDCVLVLVLEVLKETFVCNFSILLLDVLKKYKQENILIGLSARLRGVKNIATAYIQAKFAVEVGKIFNDKSNILSYNDLGLARIIYKLPKTLCDLYLEEVFKGKYDEVLDGEMLLTVERFFSNSLNLSQTSRELFVHRNTMTHRLDKINELIGLDIRNFDDAIKFKIGMMIKSYLDSYKEMLYQQMDME